MKHSSGYVVIYTGRIMPQLQQETVVSNLVLGLGLSDDKARKLLGSPEVVVKRYEQGSDAQRLAERLEQAGLVVRVESVASRAQQPGTPSKGDSSLRRLLGAARPGKAGNQSIFARWFGSSRG